MIELADPSLPPGSAQPTHGQSLSDLAYNAVSEMIRWRRLRSGEVVVEARLTEALGISRTPLREALQRLEGEGLLVKQGTRSFVVRQVHMKEYLQSLKVREFLEAEAAAMAVGHVAPEVLAQVRTEIEELRRITSYRTDAHWRSDDRVHALLIEGCGNDVLGDTIRRLRVTTRLFEVARLQDRLEPDSVEHLAIVAALEAEDPRAARRAAAAHIRSLFDFAVDTLR
jgi:DNA-binding GntR family transcriptional regulator